MKEGACLRRGPSRPSRLLQVALLACALLVVGSSLAPALAQGNSPGNDHKPSFEEVRQTYQQVVKDPTFLQLKAQLRGNLENKVVVDRYLKFLPISPLDMLKVEMFENRFEIAVPRIIAEWHFRWLELHGKAVDSAVSSGLEGEGVGSGVTAEAATVGTNRNVAATFSPAPLDYQGEIQVVVNPNNPMQIVAAANTWDEIGGTCGSYGLQAAFYSSDGGVTWGYTCPPDHTAYHGIDPNLDCTALGGGTFGSDPALAWDDAGNVYLNHMLICYNGSYYYSMVVAKSSNGGATWNAHGVLKNSYATGDLEDKNFYVIDNNPGSPYYGRHYSCWDRNNNEVLARSTDGGATWTEADLPTTSGSCGGFNYRYDLGCEMAVEDNGTVHVIYDTLSCFQSCSCEQMYYARSTDGGATWSSPLQVGDFNLVAFSNDSTPDAQDNRGIGPFGAIDVDNSGGACDGTLYTTYTDHTGGGANTADVWVIRSTNGGSTWGSPVLVNSDGPGGNIQFHPFLKVDQSTGDVIVAWHDARNDPGNDAVDYFVGRSTDCGLTFENIQGSQPSSEFNNSTISYSNENTADNPGANPNQYGEYLGLDALGGKAYVAWTDTRHFFPNFTTEPQKENLGFVVVEFGAPVCDNDGVCEAGEDCNNCPNDCISGGGGGAACGNGICEAGDGEDCVSCPSDCNGVQKGKPSNRFCCGDGDGTNPVTCADSRCTTGGFQCTDVPVGGGTSYCCGDGTCEGNEDPFNCAIDCA